LALHLHRAETTLNLAQPCAALAEQQGCCGRMLMTHLCRTPEPSLAQLPAGLWL
jgi:hypothetical protein